MRINNSMNYEVMNEKLNFQKKLSNCKPLKKYVSPEMKKMKIESKKDLCAYNGDYDYTKTYREGSEDQYGYEHAFRILTVYYKKCKDGIKNVFQEYSPWQQL